MYDVHLKHLLFHVTVLGMGKGCICMGMEREQQEDKARLNYWLPDSVFLRLCKQLRNAKVTSIVTYGTYL